MRRVEQLLSLVLPALVVSLSLCAGPGHVMLAQTTHVMPAGDQSTAQSTFTGIILRSGDKLVLVDNGNKTTYQLDDQLKAQEFVNKTTKITGVLDPSTGTIHVSAIELV